MQNTRAIIEFVLAGKEWAPIHTELAPYLGKGQSPPPVSYTSTSDSENNN